MTIAQALAVIRELTLNGSTNSFLKSFEKSAQNMHHPLVFNKNGCYSYNCYTQKYMYIAAQCHAIPVTAVFFFGLVAAD